jgi:hypothetical protein
VSCDRSSPTSFGSLSCLVGDLATNAEDADDNEVLQQQYASGLSEFNTNMAGFQTAYAKTASSLDDGLANYDRTNDLETLLKNVVNVNKYTLTSTSMFVDKLPVVGPALGPSEHPDSPPREHILIPLLAVVYETKCIIDQILDITENFSDATINQLTPVLQSLLGKMITPACNTDVDVVGLCI